MPDSPALTTYEAWDTIYRFMCGPKLEHRLSVPVWGDSMPEITNAYDLDQQGGPGHGRYAWRPTLHLNSTHGIRAVASMNGRFIYDLGRLNGGSFSDHLFTLAPDGSFRLGYEFDGNMTWRWGPFDHVSDLTKFLRHGYDIKGGKVWYINDATEAYHFLHVREWRKPIPYFRASVLPSSTWLQAVHDDGYWRAEVIPGQDMHVTRQEQLQQEHDRASERYARYRRRYHKEHGLPDPDKRLNRSDIEAVAHITQHINLYEPGKARFLRDVTPAC